MAVTFAMTTIAQYIFMKDITIMDFQRVTIMHAMNVMIRCLDTNLF
jgi:hypothetical protein